VKEGKVEDKDRVLEVGEEAEDMDKNGKEVEEEAEKIEQSSQPMQLVAQVS
jgi:hypothetical protein